MLTHMDSLDAKALRAILTQPKNAIIKQYKALFALDEIEFSISDGALDFIVERTSSDKQIGLILGKIQRFIDTAIALSDNSFWSRSFAWVV